jgi:CRP/FNR family transcriptional regulator, global nitrogen regulator
VVKLSEAYSGSRNFVFLVGPWEIFGHLVLAKGPVERAYAKAVTDCKVVKVPKVFVERAMRRQPEVALKLMTLQEIRLVQYEDLLGCLLPRKREARLANLLIILVQKFGDYPNIGQPTIGLQLPRQDLAEMVASTRESVTKTLNDLRNRKMIEIAGGRIVVSNPEELAKIGRF